MVRNNPINGLDAYGFDLLDDASNFSSGWGDKLSFGATGRIRQWMGTDDVVNRCSGSYKVGGFIGMVHQTVLINSLSGGAAGMSIKAVEGAETAAVGGASIVRVGQAGEAAVREVADIGGKSLIRVAGRGRIPDGLTDTVLTEVKNVASQSYTQQLRDFAAHAGAKGLRFDLWVRPDTAAGVGTKLSGPLREAEARGIVNILKIPFK